ncbi:hypothetical protein D3C79_852680 [compost metagenome]
MHQPAPPSSSRPAPMPARPAMRAHHAAQYAHERFQRLRWRPRLHRTCNRPPRCCQGNNPASTPGPSGIQAPPAGPGPGHSRHRPKGSHCPAQAPQRAFRPAPALQATAPSRPRSMLAGKAPPPSPGDGSVPGSSGRHDRCNQDHSAPAKRRLHRPEIPPTPMLFHP